MNLRPRRTEAPRVDITPLIDVVFLLLIFFMVSTTFDKKTALNVELPSAASVEKQEKTPEEIAITIDPRGHFYLNDRELLKHDRETLQQTLRELAQARTDIPVIVSGDRNAPLQAALTVMDVAAALGMTKIRFVAHQQATDD